MFLDPDKLTEAAPADVLAEAASGHIGLDHRFLHAILDRPAESLPAVVEFANRDRSKDRLDLAQDLVAFFRHWKAPEGIPFMVNYLKEEPIEVPDELIYALVDQAPQALEPLLKLFAELDETDSGEVAFILANLGIRDQRILDLLTDRLEYDLTDTLLLLDMYGDPAAAPAIEKAAAVLEAKDAQIHQEVASALTALQAQGKSENKLDREPFDIWENYPEEADPPIDDLDDDERFELLAHPVASVRAAAAHSFFNQQLTPEQKKKLLDLAQHDESADVRGRSWEASH